VVVNLADLIYKVTRNIFKVYARLIMRVEVKGVENIPESGPFVVMSNHISYLDPPLIGSIIPQKVHYMAKAELFENRIVGAFLKKLGAFPLKRGTGDSRAFRKAIKILRNDQVLGIFPEGTRYPEGSPGEPHSGSVMLAIMAKSPILPIGIKNIKRKGRTKVIIGEPLVLEEYFGKKLSKEERQEVANEVMSKIISLLNE